MPQSKINKKGVAMFMVLATILVVVVLANVVLSIISSQSRLTRHEVSRVQAYYAAQAGLIYTMEKIRINDWPFSGGVDRYYCMALTSGGPGQCIDVGVPDNIIPFDAGVTRAYDPGTGLQGSYKVQVKVYADGTGNPVPPANTRCVEAKVDYTFQ